MIKYVEEKAVEHSININNFNIKCDLLNSSTSNLKGLKDDTKIIESKVEQEEKKNSIDIVTNSDSLSKQLINVSPSATLVINEQSALLKRTGKHVFKFGFGQSPFYPPERIQDALKNNAKSKEYTPVQGLSELREAVAKFHTSLLTNTQVSYTTEQVMIAPGSKAVIYSVMMAFKEADVYVITPSWVSYAPQALMVGHDVVRIQTSHEDSWRLTPSLLNETIEKRLEDPLNYKKNCTKLLIINYPGNPDGLSYTDEELMALASVARKHNLIVISDEIYGLLNFQGKYSSLANFYPEGTLVSTGLSKWCGAGGWRLGALLIPSNFVTALMPVLCGIASETYSCAPSPIQWAAITAYESVESNEEYLNNERKVLSRIGNFVANTLQSAGIHCLNPVGGFYVMPNFDPIREKIATKGIHTSQQLCSQILVDTGVAILPGNAFGFGDHYLTARLAFVDFSGEDILRAIEQKGLQIVEEEDFIQTHAPNIYEGIMRLSQWIQQC